MTSRINSLSTWHLVLFCLGIFGTNVYGSQFRHIGCFKISSKTLGMRYNYQQLVLEQCATGCNRDGYPFFALREGHDCLCVNDFGREGKAAYAALCNYTCRTGDFHFLCGGVNYEDIYYAVDTDKTTFLPLRDNVLHEELDSFQNARMSCVEKNGDLPILVNQKHIDAVWSVARNSNYTGVWMGAYRESWGNGIFDWAGLQIADPRSLLDISDTSVHWNTDSVYSSAGHCVILLRDVAKLKVVHCNESYPHICLQIPPPDTTTETDQTTPPLATTVPPEDFWASNKWTLFWVFLPIFIILFVGSCLIYTIYHVIILCRDLYRSSAYRKDVDSDSRPFVDMEEDNRPRTVSDVNVYNRAYKGTPVQKVNLEEENICVTPPPAPIMTSESNIKAQQSSKSVVPDPDADIDFTKLSISDIVYIKSIVGGSRKNKKEKAGQKKSKAVSST